MMATYLAEAFGLSVLFERERWEVRAGTEHFGLREDRHSAYAVDLHLYIWVAVGVP